MNRLPCWFKQELPDKGNQSCYLKILRSLRLQTVCEGAHCPNLGKCFLKNSLTFMILGNICTRNCGFCAVEKGRPCQPDTQEPDKIGEVSLLLGLKYMVITSVTRDDLLDGGAHQFSLTVKSIRQFNQAAKIEVLIPDFNNNFDALEAVVESHPDVIGHNIDTVPGLYEKVKDNNSSYKRSINLLKMIKDVDSSIYTKSSLMLGLGETKYEVIDAMKDLRKSNCDILTVGQYLAPSPRHLKVERFILPQDFEDYNDIGLSLGFKTVYTGPLVRSSYRAGEIFQKCMEC